VVALPVVIADPQACGMEGLMSIGYHFRRLLLEHKLRCSIGAAEYCRAVRRQAERGVWHHDAQAEEARMQLAMLEHRADLARLGGGGT
jgi:hypothetical protein